jgi:NAD(P)H-flavin reductase
LSGGEAGGVAGGTNPMLPLPFPVACAVRESHDTVSLVLTPPSGAFPFRPGQFNMLYVFGAGESAISISGPPAEPERLVHTVRGVGAVTRLVQRLESGDAVGIRGPFGNGWPLEAVRGRDLVVVAGGIGLAPLRPVIYEALRRREEFRRVSILYGARTPGDVLFADELAGWRKRFDVELEVTVDRADAGWRGKTGVVTGLFDRADFEPARAVAMVCGPEIMMRFAARELQDMGVSADRVYVTVERNMQCAIAHCGHCQWGPELICRDGPVYRFDRVARLFAMREV